MLMNGTTREGHHSCTGMFMHLPLSLNSPPHMWMPLNYHLNCLSCTNVLYVCELCSSLFIAHSSIHSRGVHLSCASLLIQGNAGLDKQSSDGSTVIHLASAVGAIALIELLILNDADPDIRDFEGRLPLHWATMSHSSKCAALLLKVSVDTKGLYNKTIWL